MRNLLISKVANFLFWWTKQIFFLVIKLEPLLLSWLQTRKINCVPTELDVSISAIVKSEFCNLVGLITSTKNVQKKFQSHFCDQWSISFSLKSFYQIPLIWSKYYSRWCIIETFKTRSNVYQHSFFSRFWIWH
jgi:hypothetical protein